MFPTNADLSFWQLKTFPAWAKGPRPDANIDRVVNSHSGSKVPLFIHNTFALFRLWQSNQQRARLISTPKAFCEYITSHGPSNQRERYLYCRRVLRRLENKGEA